MSKFTLFLALCLTIGLTGCKVQKQINKSATETESASKVDSSGVKKNDIEKVSKVETETVEEVDSTAFITPEGKLITDKSDVTKESIAVPIKKKKTTKRTEDIKETDKSESKGEVRKSEKKEDAKTAISKDIKKTSLFPWWIWLIVLAILIAVAWRYRKFLGL